MRPVGIVILAAGGSVRMGGPKQLLPFRGTTLLRHSVRIALATGFARIVVVLGAAEDECRAQLRDLNVIVVTHKDWAEGMGSSLRVGMEELERISPESEAVLVMLPDQPLVTPENLLALAGLWQPPARLMAAAYYNGTVGVPAIFDRSHFHELKSLPKTEGARSVLRRHGSEVSTLDMPEAALDIDSPEDYERLSKD